MALCSLSTRHQESQERRGFCACDLGSAFEATYQGQDARMLSGIRPNLQGCRCRASANLNQRMAARYAQAHLLRAHRQRPGSRCLLTPSDAILLRSCLFQGFEDAPEDAGSLGYGSPAEMNSISNSVLFARIDVAIGRVDRSKLDDDDHLASFITYGVADRVDNYIRAIKVEDRPAGWSYQRLLSRVVADMTGAGAMPNDWRTEKMGDRMSGNLRKVYLKEVARIKKQAASQRPQRLKELAEECYFCKHGGTPTMTLDAALAMPPPRKVAWSTVPDTEPQRRAGRELYESRWLPSMCLFRW